MEDQFSEDDNINILFSGHFFRNIALIFVFLFLTPITLGTSVFSLVTLSSETQDETKAEVLGVRNDFSKDTPSGVSLYASLPQSVPQISFEAQELDARVEIVSQYLNRYNSPLGPYAKHLVDMADKYDIDFRLVAAIAQKESNLCKIIPPDSYNCWGWGIHSRGTLHFSSFEEGIEIVSRGLKEDYLDRGYRTVEEIMSKYTPLSNGSWAEGVTQFMEEMQ